MCLVVGLKHDKCHSWASRFSRAYTIMLAHFFSKYFQLRIAALSNYSWCFSPAVTPPTTSPSCLCPSSCYPPYHFSQLSLSLPHSSSSSSSSSSSAAAAAAAPAAGSSTRTQQYDHHDHVFDCSTTYCSTSPYQHFHSEWLTSFRFVSTTTPHPTTRSKGKVQRLSLFNMTG